MDSVKTNNNTLLIDFRILINNVFKSNGLNCKVLSYDNELFYSFIDILKSFNYEVNKESIIDSLSKINKEDQFTIKELQVKYTFYKSDFDPNQSLINSLSKDESKEIYINNNGLRHIISHMIKPIPYNFINISKALNINISKKYLKSEEETIKNLVKVFKYQNYKLQYFIKGYIIDLYFKNYKLAIESEDNNILYYNREDKLERELVIKKKLGCDFIRFNTRDINFDIFELISKILLFMKLFNKIN